MSEIDIKRDIAGGRRTYDIQTAKNTKIGKCFTSINYSADGECVIGGGRSKYICIYECENGLLLKKYQISYNRSLDGILDKLNSKFVTEAGPLDDINDSELYIYTYIIIMLHINILHFSIFIYFISIEILMKKIYFLVYKDTN